MAFETTVVFRDMDVSAPLQDDIVRHAAKLEQFAPRILACHVSVARAEHRHHHGNRYVVHARVTLPGAELQAGQTRAPNRAHEDPHRAVTDTFDALRRQLEDLVRKQRDESRAPVDSA